MYWAPHTLNNCLKYHYQDNFSTQERCLSSLLHFVILPSAQKTDRSLTQWPLCEEGSERLWLRGLPGLEHPQGERAAVAEPPHGLHKAAAAPLSATPLPFAKHQLASVKYLANPCSEDSRKVPLWRQ